MEEGAVEGRSSAVGGQVEQVPEPVGPGVGVVDRFETLAPIGHKVGLVPVGQLPAVDL